MVMIEACHCLNDARRAYQFPITRRRCSSSAEADGNGHCLTAAEFPFSATAVQSRQPSSSGTSRLGSYLIHSPKLAGVLDRFVSFEPHPPRVKRNGRFETNSRRPLRFASAATGSRHHRSSRVKRGAARPRRLPRPDSLSRIRIIRHPAPSDRPCGSSALT
jgi:hypothetical protein